MPKNDDLKIKVTKNKEIMVKQSNVVLDEEDTADIINTIQAEYEKGESNRSTFHDKLTKIFRMRYGIRKNTNFPFKNASNLSMPLIDKTIRKMKPEYINAVWSQKPMCTLTPVDEAVYDLAQQSSYHLDWLLRTRMNIFPQLVRIPDIMLHKGFVIAKVVYEKRYEPVTIIINKGEEKKKFRKKLIDKAQADIFDNPEKADILIATIASTYGYDMEDKTDNAKVNSIVMNIYKSEDKDNIEFTVDKLVYDAPRLIVLDPESVVIPADTITEFDFEGAPMIIHRYQVSSTDMIANVADEKWDADVVNECLALKGIRTSEDLELSRIKTALNRDKFRAEEDSEKDNREGTGNPTTKDIFTILECCYWRDSDGDGKAERHIIEYCEDYKIKALRNIKYPYNMNMWPFVKIPFELTDGAHYSTRGVAEMLYPLNAALNEQTNMRLNRQYLGNTPIAFYNVDQISKYEFQNLTLGKPVAVKGDTKTAVTWQTAPSNDLTFVQEEDILRSWAEDISSSSDMVVTNSSKTAAEAKMGASYRAGVRQADIDIFNMALREVFKRVWELWLQFGPTSVFSPISEDDTQTQEYILSGFNKNWNFNVNGQLGQGDPIIDAQKALARLDRFKGDLRIRQNELYKDYLRKDDFLLSKKLLKSDAEFKADLASEMEQQAAMMNNEAAESNGKKQMMGSQPR
jgi:hypothetical protein